MCKGLVWLREQILHGGGPAWLEPEAAAAGQEDLPQQDQAHQEQAPDEGTVKSVFKEYLDFDANKSNWRRRIPCLLPNLLSGEHGLHVSNNYIRNTEQVYFLPYPNLRGFSIVF